MKNKRIGGVLSGVLLVALSVGGIGQFATAHAGADLMDPGVDPHDREAIQRGAQAFVNNCMGCHSVEFLRYSRLGQDANIDEDLLEKYLVPAETEVTEHMISSMRPEDGENWFGIAVPDLSLTTRERGEAWVYTFLNGFYRDENTETGYNNLVQENSAMPHVLAVLQGVPEPVYADDGETVVGTEVPEDRRGRLSEEEYRAKTADIVSFLAYAAEPVRADRERLGMWVLLFLVVLTGILYLLKKEYWKDVH